jgi:hypothetical protein
MAGLAAFGKHHRIGQELHLSVQLTGRFQRVHQPGLIAKIVLVLRFRQRDRQRLQIVVAQHERRHLFGHIHQERVAVLARQLASCFGRTERNLDVHLKVGGVDAGGVIDGIGVEPHAMQAGFDPRLLGDTKIGTLADHLDAQLRRIDADRIIGPVTGFSLLSPVALM